MTGRAETRHLREDRGVNIALIPEFARWFAFFHNVQHSTLPIHLFSLWCQAMETRISNFIDLTDDEFPSSMNSKLRAENQDLVRRNADLISCTHELERRNLDLKSAHSNLEAKLADMQEENERLKADLKDTQAMLGEAVVSAKRQVRMAAS